MEKIKVTKEITFDAAHMLSDYKGLCANVHGHTYKLQVTLKGQVEKQSGMVLDFNELKTSMEVIKNQLDHAWIFSDTKHRNEKEEAFFKMVQSFNMRHVVIKGKCTAENMALFIKGVFNVAMASWNYNNIEEVSIKLWETPTSFVEV